jgi:hypothetical protein
LNTEAEGDMAEENEHKNLMCLIQQLPKCKNSNKMFVKEWFNKDDRYEITDNSIIQTIKEKTNESSY